MKKIEEKIQFFRKFKITLHKFLKNDSSKTWKCVTQKT
jgi:hypothetical protein